ncbi:MAG: DUF308 domain-containing protein [Myxococcota bacterium]
MSTIFIAIALVTAAMAILMVFGALLVLGGVVAIRSAEDSARVEPSEPRPVSDPRSLVPTREIAHTPQARRVPPPTTPLHDELEDSGGESPHDDPTATHHFGGEVRAYGGDSTNEIQATEMFGSNAGDFADLGLEDDDRR